MHAYTRPPPHTSGRVSHGKIALQEKTRSLETNSSERMEIELGHYSDMPGVVYYKYKLDKKGRVLRDEDGLALLKCNRGTNDVEATHRVINKMLGTSSCGEEFAERLGRWASASLQP